MAKAARSPGTHPLIEQLAVSAYSIPTDFPEADGTYAWDQTTLVLVEAGAGGQTGLGYSYASAAAAQVAGGVLARVSIGRSALSISGCWMAMRAELRNAGRPGIGATAISAVDNALWDLKARLLGIPLASLLGLAHEAVPAYGSGGFTSYPIARLQQQLGRWAGEGLPAVKMKVGTLAIDDPERVRAAREAIGAAVELYVDANGAYSRKQALAQAEAFAAYGVTWFEEPVSSDDLDGLRLLRDRAPAGMAIAAGEYGYDLDYFRRMLERGAVDVLQADATRCGGITGFLAAGALAEAANVPLSAHTSPTLHGHAGCGVRPMLNVEYFHDHARIEQMFFDGSLRPVHGLLRPDLSRPGLGIEFKRQDAAPYLIYQHEARGE